jgi:uncharacterized repeat protein (TIGR02543 family)
MVTAVIFYCGNLPENPTDPSKTAISAVIKTTDGKIFTNSLADTVNKKFLVGAALRLSENFDSIRFLISFKNDTIIDTMFILSGIVTSYADTLWIEQTLFSPGIYYATLKPYTSLSTNLSPATIDIMMVEADVMPENHKPSISVSGNTILKPGDTCVLSVTKTDPDTKQILTTSTKGKPEGSLLKDNKFTWIIPSTFAGRDTILFIVSDNGYPQESDSQTVVITVTSTPHAPIITISGDSVVKPLETCILTVHTSDKDSGQLLVVTMAGQPEGAVLVNDSQFTWTAPNVTPAKHTVTFTVTDNGIPPLSTSASVTIQVSADSGTQNPTFTVTYLGNGSTSGTAPVDSNKYISGASVTVATAGTLIKTGSTFTGWNTNAAGTGIAKAAGSAYVIGAANDTLYAQWKVKQYSVIYDDNDASGGTVPADATRHDSASTVTVMVNTGSLVKTGYIFDGWNTAADGKGTTYTAGTGTFAISADITLFAKWKVKTYTLRYDGNGNTGGDVPEDAVYDSNTTVAVAGNTNSLVKGGFDFNGWNTKADGSGVILAAASTFKIKSDTTLYAQWIVKKYNLSIETPVNGTVNLSGIVSVDSAVVKSITATPSAGYKFKCWRVVSGTAQIADTVSATTTVTLTDGNATIKAVFAGLTFVKQLQMAQYSELSIKDVVQADDGSYILAGIVTDNTSIVIKLDINGDTVWTRTFPTVIYGVESIQKASNSFIITGSYNSQAAAVCFSLTGNLQWSYCTNETDKTFQGSVTRMTSDNGYIIAGSSYIDDAFFLIKTDAVRHNVWSFRYKVDGDGGRADRTDCVQTHDGGYMMAGTFAIDRWGYKPCIIKVNSEGEREWTNYYESELENSGAVIMTNSIENTMDGDCVISVTGSNLQCHLLKISQAGDVRLFKNYPNASQIASIQPQSDGYFIAGTTTLLGSGQEDIYIAKVNSSGTIVKETAYGTSTDNEYSTGMKLTSDGGCIVVGADNWVIKTDENGEVK